MLLPTAFPIGWDESCTAAEEAVRAFDRAFFDVNKCRKLYARPMIEGELGHVGTDTGNVVLVLVSQLKPGRRARRLYAVPSARARRLLAMREAELVRETLRQSRPVWALCPGSVVNGKVLGVRP